MRRVHLSIVVGLLGLGLLVSPLYFSLPSGAPLHPTFQPVNDSTCTSTIAYADLPPRASHSFDVTPHDDLPSFNDTLYTGQEAEAIEAFRNYECINKDGRLYKIELIHTDGAGLTSPGMVRFVLFAAGGLTLIGAILLLPPNND